MKHCNIYGYPVDSKGMLMGSKGAAKISKDNIGEWEYKIHTFPGESGSALYVWNGDEDKFRIYGIHTFGDVVQQVNIGVKLNEEHYNWISDTIEKVMIPAMNEHKTKRGGGKKKKSESSDLQVFLETIGLGHYYKNFKDRGCDKMNDLKEAKVNSNDLKDEFLITEWKHRKQILEGVKGYFANGNKAKEKYQRKIQEKVNENDKLNDKIMDLLKEKEKNNVFSEEKKNDNNKMDLNTFWGIY
eukprot:312022_1